MNPAPDTDDPRSTRDDLGMMRRADLWPRWPHLFVKRPRWDTGTLIEEGDTNEALPIVYRFPFRGGGEPPEIVASYDSLEELVADGWVVD